MANRIAGYLARIRKRLRAERDLFDVLVKINCPVCGMSMSGIFSVKHVLVWHPHNAEKVVVAIFKSRKRLLDKRRVSGKHSA